jgi:hypothetical protein
VQTSTTPLRVTVSLPQWNIAKPPLEMVFTNTTYSDSNVKSLSLDVLNPRFFHGFFNANSISEYLNISYIQSDDEHKPFQVDDLSLLETLLSQKTTVYPVVPSVAGFLMAVLIRGNKPSLHAADRFFLAGESRNAYVVGVAEAVLINRATYAEAVYYEIAKALLTVSVGGSIFGLTAMMLR